MEMNQLELEFETQRLEQTIALAKKQINQAKQDNEENKSAIATAKEEMRENASHSIANLWGSEGFEALAELSQYANPVLDKIATFEALENKIALLENLVRSPYFARVDFKFEDEAVFEKVYIGRAPLMDGNSYEMVVYDWRSPIASVFYRFVTGQAYYEAPSGRITGEISLKRQYEINNGALEYFFDADVQIIDEFLRKLLSQNTSPKMKTIVETIQKEQDIVIRDMENDLMMVQGVAGSGKTSIALHRAAYLMYQGLSSKLSANNIVIISPNTLFEQYISHVLPELGEENVVSLTFEDIMAKILRSKHIQSRNQFLENLLTSQQNGGIIKQSMEFKSSGLFLEILNLFIEDLPHRWINFDDIYYKGRRIVSKEQLKERILSGRKRTPLGVKLKQLEEFIIESVKDAAGGKIRKSEEFAIKKDIQNFTELNIEVLYNKLFSDKQYFLHLAKDIRLPSCIGKILAFTRQNLYNRSFSYDDAAALSFFILKLYGSNQYRNIKQVVIDEAQDYYPIHYEILNLLFSNAKFTVLGDINQTLEKQEDLSLYDQIREILNKKKASLVTMNKSFRCTNEILNFSAQFIGQNSEIQRFNRKGEEPELRISQGQGSLNASIIAEVKTCLDKGYQSVGLICKTEKNAHFLYEQLKGNMEIKLIKNGSSADLQGVFIIPVYMSKGLEFDAVLICDCDDRNYHSEDDKKLLYIACTRALHRLNLFGKDKASRLMK